MGNPIRSYTIHVIDEQGRVFGSRVSFDRYPIDGPRKDAERIANHVGMAAQEGVILLECRRKDDPEGRHIQPHERILRGVIHAVEAGVVETLTVKDHDDERERQDQAVPAS